MEKNLVQKKMLSFKNNKLYDCDGEITIKELSLCYTKKEDNLRDFKRLSCSPFGDRKALFNGDAEKLGAKLSVEKIDGGLRFNLQGGENFSEFGINMPLGFMGMKGGNWKKQYLFNSPYRSIDNEHIYIYLTSVERKHLLIVFESQADGWKMDYSPYVGGHYFYNLKLLASFPKEYGQGCKFHNLEFSMYEVDNFEEALLIVSNTKKLPVLYPDLNAGSKGDNIKVKVYGECDKVVYGDDCYFVENGKVTLPVKVGTNYAIPYINGKKGLDCSLYGFNSYQSLYKQYLDGILRDGLQDEYGNLCEWQCWLSAMLRYMSKYGYNQEYAKLCKSALSKIMCDDESKAIKEYSILTKPHDGLPAYNVYKSQRVQNHFFGVGILLDAYNLFKEEKYLQFAINALDSVLAFHQREDGRIETFTDWLGIYEDYSTVCCLMIYIVDMCNALKTIYPQKSERYKNSAKKLAEYLYSRGLVFPTEGGADDEAEQEMEDGSISCTALSLLYYSKYVEFNKKYIEKAKEILDLHEAWVVKTPLCCMQGSSLRWWETAWEGDKDGPALCMGHAWTIWRAEADYRMYELSGEVEYLKKARRGYFTNLAKIDKNGRSYSIFQIDYITGWRFFEDKDVRYELAKPFPEHFDNGLTAYAFSRAFDIELEKKSYT